jgi:hypothetical protein
MPWSARTDKRRWVVLAAAALVVAWTAAPAAVPLYDGCCNPDEPYRYVAAPPGYAETRAPTTGRLTVRSPTVHARPGYVNTAELGPQASLYVPAGALEVPNGTHQLTLTVTPESPPSRAPANGRVTGNVYRVAAEADAQPVPLRAGTSRPSVQLRAPSPKQPGPVLEHYDRAGWHRAVRTTRTGIDTYEAEVDALGDWALVQLNRPQAKNSGVDLGLLAAGIAVLGVSVSVMVIRQRRGRPRPDL